VTLSLREGGEYCFQRNLWLPRIAPFITWFCRLVLPIEPKYAE
jgi:hypothetical protein